MNEYTMILAFHVDLSVLAYMTKYIIFIISNEKWYLSRKFDHISWVAFNKHDIIYKIEVEWEFGIKDTCEPEYSLYRWNWIIWLNQADKYLF